MKKKEARFDQVNLMSSLPGRKTVSINVLSNGTDPIIIGLRKRSVLFKFWTDWSND